ncbi:hypothetical protein V5O39_02435 [Pseudomonas parakoreensis]
MPFTNRDDGLTKVAVYGAGVAGNQLVAALRMGRVMRPVAFIDDDPGISDRSISGLQVYKPKHIQQMIDMTGAQEILLALPSSTRARRRKFSIYWKASASRAQCSQFHRPCQRASESPRHSGSRYCRFAGTRCGAGSA